MERKKHKSGILICLLIIGMILFLLPLHTVSASETLKEKESVDPVNEKENYSAVLYDNTNGLPTSEANAIAQTSEGFIWIGCYSGLIRYDGNTFERMDSTTGITSVVCLHVDQKDRLWIGTNDNGLAMLERGEYRMWNENDLLGSAKICAIEEDNKGNIYVGTTAGIVMIDEDLNLHRLHDSRIDSIYMEQICLGSDGLIHCLSNQDDFFTLQDGKPIYFSDHTQTSVQDITSIYPDPQDPEKIYFGTGESALYHGNPRLGPDEQECIDISPLFSVMGIRMIDDKIWLCARNGIGVIDDQGFHHLSDLPMNNSVNQIMKDYEGNLWFTSSRQGLMKVVSNRFSSLFTRYSLPSRVVNSTCMYEGKLFIATDTGLMVLDENGAVSSVPLRSAGTASGSKLQCDDLLELLDDCRIRSVIRDSQNRLWISTWRAEGLIRYDHGEVTAFTEEDGMLSEHIRVVCETADGKMLAAVTGGVNIIEGDQVTASYGKKDGIVNEETLTVCSAPNGDIVLGSNGGGIYVINDEGVRCVGLEEGLSSGIVMRIKYDSARNVFWIVTSNSIAWMTPDYQVNTIKEFPYSNNFDLYENSKGDIWVLSSNGIYVASAEELIANGEIQTIHYSIANGLPCITTSNSYSELTDEGDLYIAGNLGVVKVNIDTPMEDTADLKQAVPFIEADGVRFYPDETGTFTIPSRTEKLTVYPYVFNYSLTDPQVSYSLEGFDKQMVTVKRSDLRPITYTHLPGGDYQFTMELKDAMGRGSKTLSVPIVKEKTLFEYPGIYAILGVYAVLILDAINRRIVQRKIRILEKKQKEEMEKKRIENELDTAKQIQVGMIPHVFPPFPDRKEFDIYASMDPAREVGGDFYDIFLIDDDHLGIVMADVSGKGIPAALFMMASKIILQSCAMLGKSASETLTKTNEAICSNNQAEMFVTVWFGILEISTGKLRASNAGHEYPVLMKNGVFSLLKDKHGFVIGGLDGSVYSEYNIQLEPGDKIFLYTDGIPEASDRKHQLFGNQRMLDALNEDPHASVEQILHNVRRNVDDFVKDAEQFDDLTMLCLEYKGKSK